MFVQLLLSVTAGGIFRTLKWIHGNLCEHLKSAFRLRASQIELTNLSKQLLSWVVWTRSGDANAAMDACRLQQS